jgi:RNA polymerase sigma factor (sigma-70 family)
MANVLQKKAAKHQETTVTSEDGEEIDFLENMEHPDLQGNSIEGDLISRFNMQQINEAIEKIHPRYAEVIRLNMIDGLTYAQIAAELNIPQNTVSSRVSRGREELAPVLKDLAIEFGITGKKKEK